MIEIYTDGACWPNDGTGDGGWAFVVIEDGVELYGTYGGFKQTTNNRQEMYSLLKALQWMKAGMTAKFYTDSTIVCNGLRKLLISDKYLLKKHRKNTDLWFQIKQAVQGKNVEIQWIKGHSGIKYNEMADEYSVKGMDKAIEIDVRDDSVSFFKTPELSKSQLVLL